MSLLVKPPEAVTPTLSNLLVDIDKDWNAKGISNLKNLVVKDTDASPIGDVLLKVLDQKIKLRNAADNADVVLEEPYIAPEVCRDAEVNSKIAAHKADASAHHTKTQDNEVFGLLQQGTIGNRPAVGKAGRLYYATDEGILYGDNGSTWEEKARAETKVRLAQLSEKALSSLVIDADKDWNGKKITNVAAPSADADVARYADAAALAKYLWGGYLWETSFESIDGIDTSNSVGGTVTLKPDLGRIELNTGATQNNTAIADRLISFPFGVAPSWNKKRRLKAYIRFQSYSTQEVYILMGDPDGYHIGFFLDGNILKGICGTSGINRSSVEIETLTAGEFRYLEAVLTPGVECHFFVGGVDKGAATDHLPSGSSDAGKIMSLRVKTLEAVVKQLYVYCYRGLQEA